jgi:predicted esterase YcpF (UPF0227 family)
MLLYLHGFRSSPQSFKARLLASRLAKLHRPNEWCCPALDPSPKRAIAQLTSIVKDADVARLCLVGSSLGGYYATCLAEKTGCKAVLLNPAITPQKDLQNHLGEQTIWGTSERIVVHPHYLQELEAIWVPAITRAERYFLIAATHDEVIDWRDMVAKYPGAKTRVIQGGDHGLSQFGDVVDEVLEFAQLGSCN